MQSWFSAALLQSLVSHDPSEMASILWKLIKKIWILWVESSKEQCLSEIEIFCNIMNVFTVTFDQCNASLLHYLMLSVHKKSPTVSNTRWPQQN